VTTAIQTTKQKIRLARASNLSNEIIVSERSVANAGFTRYSVTFYHNSGGKTNLDFAISTQRPQYKTIAYPPLLEESPKISICYTSDSGDKHTEDLIATNWFIHIETILGNSLMGWISTRNNFVIRPFLIAVNSRELNYSFRDTGIRADADKKDKAFEYLGRSFEIRLGENFVSPSADVEIYYKDCSAPAKTQIIRNNLPNKAITGINKATKSKTECHLAGEARTELGGKVCILMPVYNGYTETIEAVASVVASLKKNKVKTRIIVGLDNPTNHALNNKIREIYKSWEPVHVVTNTSNLGFIGNCNNLYRFKKPDEDILLVNSDIIAPDSNWIDRMYNLARSNDGIGTVTPMSNKATIFSFPIPNVEQERLQGLSTTEQDRLFVDALSEESRHLIEVPTCHGFCTLLLTTRIEEAILFDPQYGKGYGEENDLSMRIKGKGFINVACPNVFVYHHESVSFSQEKHALIKKNLEILGEAHPDYHQLVDTFIELDPLRQSRNKIMRRYFQERLSPKSSTVHISHFRGGGTDKYVRESTNIRGNQSHFAMRPYPTKPGIVQLSAIYRNTAKVAFNECILLTEHEFLDDSLRLFEGFHVSEVVIHSLIDYLQFGNIGKAWGTLSRYVKLTTVIHDYHWVCQNENLLDRKGVFRKNPPPTTCSDIALLCQYPPSKRNSILARSQSEHSLCFSEVLERSTSVIAPSDSARFTLLQYAGKARTFKIHTAYHDNSGISRDFLNSCNRPPIQRIEGIAHVLVIGAIGPNKGIDLLCDLCRSINAKSLPIKIHIIGHTSSDKILQSLGESVAISGKYTDEELPNLIRDSKGRCALFLSPWPETYSYTLSIAFEHKIWPIAINLGAPGERITKAGYGSLLETPTVEAICSKILELHPE
jgi:GT2 family glycosyltransferase